MASMTLTVESVAAARDAATVPAGEGGMVVAYASGLPSGSGGVTMVDGVARLWGGVRSGVRAAGFMIVKDPQLIRCFIYI
jgi:hypothetical protein